MVQIPLTQGSYESKSIVANAQRCVNLYAEQNAPDAPFPFTFYTTPGTVELWRGTFDIETGPAFAGRGLYRSSLNGLYAVIGNAVYYFTAISNEAIAFSLQGEVIGNINSIGTPVNMYDNGVTLFIVDSTQVYYTINISPDAVDENGDPIPFNQFTAVNNDAFYGSNTVSYLDGFMIFNRPNTREFYITDFISTNLDGLQFASKISDSDLLVGCASNKQLLYLFGQNTTEIWYNSGDLFPFARTPGALINHGALTPYSICTYDGATFVLSRSPNGNCIVLRISGYDAQRVSTFAIEQEMTNYAAPEDCVAYIYQDGGHAFYVMNFTSDNKTWVLDVSNGLWHERAYLNDEGKLLRQRQGFHAFFEGRHIVLDYDAAVVYEMTQNEVTDNGSDILRIRSFPHMVSNGNRVKYNRFQLSAQYSHAVPVDSGNINPPTPSDIEILDGLFVFRGGDGGHIDAYKVNEDKTFSFVSTQDIAPDGIAQYWPGVSHDGRLIAYPWFGAGNGGVDIYYREGNGDSITITKLTSISEGSDCYSCSFTKDGLNLFVSKASGIEIYSVSGTGSSALFSYMNTVSTTSVVFKILVSPMGGYLGGCNISSGEAMYLYKINDSGVDLTLTKITVPDQPIGYITSVAFTKDDSIAYYSSITATPNVCLARAISGTTATTLATANTSVLSNNANAVTGSNVVINSLISGPTGRIETQIYDSGSVVEVQANAVEGTQYTSDFMRVSYESDVVFFLQESTGSIAPLAIAGEGASTIITDTSDYGSISDTSIYSFALIRKI